MPRPLDQLRKSDFPKPPGPSYARRMAESYNDNSTAKPLREMDRQDQVAAQRYAIAKKKPKPEEDDDKPSLGKSLRTFGSRLNSLGD